MKRFLQTLSICLLSFSCLSATRTWKGAGVTGGTGSTNFNLAANWSGAGALLTTDDLVVTLNNNSDNTLSLSANLSVKSVTITGNVTNVGSGGRIFILSVGNFTLTTSGNFTVTNSSTPSGTQTTRPFNMAVSVSSSGTLTIGGNLACTNTYGSYSDNSIDFLISGTMTVTGTVLAKSINDYTYAYVAFDVDNAPAKITFNGDVTLDDNTGGIGNGTLLAAVGSTTTGTIVFKGNLSLGYIATTYALTGATVLFDGAGTQTLTYGNTDYYLNMPNVIIGSTNNPTVNLAVANSSTPGNIENNLTVNGSSVLNLNSLQFNRNSNGGTFSLKNTSQLKLTGASSVAMGGSATLISGSNFPSGFTTVTLDSTSTVEFNGTAQTIPGTTQGVTSYGNLTTSGSSTKSLGSDIAVYRNLSIGAGTTFALGNYNTTLKSNAQTTANLTAVNGSITYGTGKFSIERYLPAKKAWRFVAAPVTSGSSQTIAASWQEGGSLASTGYGTQITGPAGSTGMDAVTNGYSMKTYDMVNNAFVPVTNTGSNIANPQGYMVFVRGDRSITTTGTTGATNLRMKGQVLTGNQVISVNAGKFQSFGNPYPSRINFKTVSNGTIVDAFTVWNPNSPGSYNVGAYETYVYDGTNYAKVPGGTVRNYIENGEAVFIQSVSGGSVTVKETDKASGSAVVSFTGGTVTADPALRINMYAPDAAGVYLADGVVINFGDNYNASVDNMDVKKVMNVADNLGITTAADKLIVERHPLLQASDTIRLNLTGTRNGTYRFQFDPSELSASGLDAFLQDKFTGSQTPVSLSSITDISFDITADAASKVADRFSITFKPANVLAISFTSITAQRNSDKTVTVSWETENEHSTADQEIQNSEDGIHFQTVGHRAAGNTGNRAAYNYIHNASVKTNYYRIRTAEAGEFHYSDIAKAGSINTNSVITVSPNPVEGKLIHLTINNLPAGTYQLEILNAEGAKIYTDALNNDINTGKIFKINVSKVAAGNYILVLQGDKCTYRQSLIIM